MQKLFKYQIREIEITSVNEYMIDMIWINEATSEIDERRPVTVL